VPNLFLTFFFDADTEAIVRAWRQRIADAGAPAVGIAGGHRPHVTLAAYQPVPESEVPRYEELVRAYAAAREPLPVRLHHLGIFPEARTAFLALLVTEPLLRLHADLHAHMRAGGCPETIFADHLAPGTWVPHTTLVAGTTTEHIFTAIGVCKGEWYAVEGTVDGIGVLSITGREKHGEPIPDRSQFPFGERRSSSR
jgi:2'-5' RNA ligase